MMWCIERKSKTNAILLTSCYYILYNYKKNLGDQTDFILIWGRKKRYNFFFNQDWPEKEHCVVFLKEMA